MITADDVRRVTNSNEFAIYRWAWKQRDEHAHEPYYAPLLENIRAHLIDDTGVTDEHVDEILRRHITEQY